MKRRRFLGSVLGAAALPVVPGDGPWATISVDGEPVPSLQEAANRGGEILLSAGVLRAAPGAAPAGAAHFRKPALVVGERTRVAGQSIENKGTFIVDADVSFAGLDVSGATGDGIGAAFRHQSGDLLVRRTRIHHCENGLLGPARYVDCSLVVEDCDVFDNGSGTGHTHGLYVGLIRAFTCIDSRFGNTHVGHHIKSRARSTAIRNCEVGSDFAGGESYNIDVPQGGDVVVVRSHLRQGPRTENRTMLNFGGERDPHPGGSLVVTGTAFESTAGGTGISIRGNVAVVARIEDCAFIGVDVPVEGTCVMRNCWHNGQPLPDGLHVT